MRKLPVALSVAAVVVAVLGFTPVGEAAKQAVLPNNSVGTKQLKDNAVKKPKIANGAVTSGKLGTLHLVESSGVLVGGGVLENGRYNTASTEATCPPGETAIAGGTRWNVALDGEEMWVVSSEFILDAAGKPVGFRARGGQDLGEDRIFFAQVICLAA
jgi:hypothetical protein